MFIYFGAKDNVLAPRVTDRASAFYTCLGADLKYQVNPETAHPMPIDLPSEQDDKIFAKVPARKKRPLDYQKFPFISNCGVDSAGLLLNHIIPRLGKF